MNEPIRTDDIVQVVKGSEWGVMGVVMGIIGTELVLWGRNPGYLGSESYKLQVKKDHVMRVGRGKVRPLRQGESRKLVPTLTAPKAEPEPEPEPEPQPQPQPQKRGPGRPRKQPLAEEPKPAEQPALREDEVQAAALQFGMEIESEELVPKPLQFGTTMDSESVIPKPKPQEEIKPELLRPVQVKRPSAYDIHKPQ